MKLKLYIIIIFTILFCNFNLHAYANIYKNIIISEQSIKRNNEIIGSKIELNKVNYSDNQSPKIGKLIWSIDSKNLPATEKQCNQNRIETCDGLSDPDTCYAPCFRYGPKFLTYNEKNNKIYFSINATSVGATGVGNRFIFEGDVNKKEIKQILLVFGPFRTILSPSGKYLLFYGLSEITIYDTETGKSFKFWKDNIWTSGHERLYYLGNVKWLNDTHFSYSESVRHDKFSPHPDSITEHIYDISTRKIISSRKIT